MPIKHLILFLFALLPCLVHGRICINEVMQSNVNGIMDDLNEIPDSWVEIFNDADADFVFTGSALGLNSNGSEAWTINESSVIPAKGHLLVYCDKASIGLHTNFRLDVDGCTVYLFNSSAMVVDSLLVPPMLAPDVAFGRIADGSDSLSYFRTSTPGKSNTGFFTNRILKKPQFSVSGGLFSAPVTLHLSLQGDCPPDAVIRYTTNGNEPTEVSPVAPDSIYIDKTTVIRAKAFSDSALSKVSKTETYVMLGRDVSLPVVSVVLDSNFLWNDKIGIYAEGDYSPEKPNYRFNWRRPANIEYFDGGAVSEINQLAEVRLTGNDTRKFYVKSLNVYAHKRFGKKRFSYKLWNDKDVENVKSFTLRNAGQDNKRSYMRDALLNFAAGRSMDVDWSANQPAIVLLNGQYFGVMNLRERTNEDYVWQNYDGLEDVDMLFLTNGTNLDVLQGNTDAWNELDVLFANPSTTYEQMAEHIDVDELCNMVVVNSLFSNFDFPGNNTLFWRKREQGSKWRWLLKDLDWTFGLNMPYDFAYLNYLTRTEPFVDRTSEGAFTNPEAACSRYRKMFQYPVFRNRYIDVASVSMGTFFSLDRMLPLVDSLAGLIESEMPFTLPLQSREFTHGWQYNLDLMKSWYVQRMPYYYQHIADFFSLGNPIPIEIYSESGRQIFFNGIRVENNHMKGKYYGGRTLYLSRNESAFAYRENGAVIDAADSAAHLTPNVWNVEYKVGNETIYRTVAKDALCFTIPSNAEYVFITDSDHAECSLFSKAQLVLTPNPTHDFVNVSGVEYGDNLILTDIVGRRLKNIFVTEKPTTISLVGLPKGVYILKHSSGCFRLIKE